MINNINSEFLNMELFKPLKETGKDRNIEKNEKALLETCKNIESIFINTLFKAMGSSLNKEKNPMGEMYQDMMYTEVSKFLADSGGIGLTHYLYEQMKKQFLEGKKD
ncbi:rod-binding protein [Candidatus Desantisbacteria bacterium]|nr:rod-binding protein [Candidatus Desantisbacteria bacterium]